MVHVSWGAETILSNLPKQVSQHESFASPASLPSSSNSPLTPPTTCSPSSSAASPSSSAVSPSSPKGTEKPEVEDSLLDEIQGELIYLRQTSSSTPTGDKKDLEEMLFLRKKKIDDDNNNLKRLEEEQNILSSCSSVESLLETVSDNPKVINKIPKKKSRYSDPVAEDDLLKRMLATLSDVEDGIEDIDALDSDFDEDEVQKELLQDKWRELFDKFDCEGFGEIPWTNFREALSHPDFISAVDIGKREQLLARSLSAQTSAITFQDFVNVLTGKRTRSFKCAVHQRDREVSSEKDFHLLLSDPPIFNRMVRLIADEFLTEERDRKYYADHYRCWPPPVFVISVTFLQLCVFCYYTVFTGEMSIGGPVPLDSPFIYRPDKRHNVWRFILYAFLHAGWVHLAFNLLVQLLIGLPLEMVHGSARIGTVYLAGVVAGSLGTSVFDSEVYLVGASGGVYALLAAHLANVLINYNNMQFGILRLVGVLFVASADVGYAIYDRYAHVTLGLPVSYVAHLTGALAGLTLGLVVLKNFEQRLHEQLLWWVALGVFGACILFALLFNVFHPYPYQGVAQSMLSSML